MEPTGLAAAGLLGGLNYSTMLGRCLSVGDEFALPFSILKITFFLGWFYLCLYSVKRSDASGLISNTYRSYFNLAALAIGPLALIVLFIADTIRRLSEGDLDIRDVPRYVMDSIVGHRKPKRRVVHNAPAIELMDTTGRVFADVYSRQIRSRSHEYETQIRTEKMTLDAIQSRASDILIDPKGDSHYAVRFRVDGFLREYDVLPAQKAQPIINSLKAISGMDIAEKRRPQDGAFMARLPEGQVYFRMASSGVLGGEKLAIRILDQTKGPMKPSEIGFSPEQIKLLKQIVEQPSGMVLVCGPTGSGKTTTLYGLLQTVDFAQRNVITIEDPIEHVIANLSQIEINTRAGVTFASALRSVLRQDPDVICIGEIRDSETAQIALQAAQTGHLVMATMHSSSNMAAIVRLMDLGVRPLLIASALKVIISQRLIRRLCPYCKGPATLSQSQVEYCERSHLDAKLLLEAHGCGHCAGTGYYGRTALMDVMYMDDALRQMLCNQTISAGELKEKGDQQFYATLRKIGMQKVIEGQTCLKEIKRVTSQL
ncbi:MAG: type II/IV secretion system protein [Planctomycetes bacterium]|nr:type II/IV secretion system protein [Planctomycetota bacterium]